MSYTTSTPHAAPLARLVGSSALRRATVVLLGSWLIAASAWIEVPMYPVPMTMQTYAVLLVGALCGWRLASETLVAYLAQGLAGLPLFAGGNAGILYAMGPTGGYLVGFLLAAAFVGWLADQGWNRHYGKLAVSLLVGHLIVFVPGVAWLAHLIGFEKAIAAGFVPFILGTVLKSALAYASVVALDRRR